MKWEHIRKGIIEGEQVEEDGEWLTIKLSRPVGNKLPGDRLVVRKSFVMKIDGDSA